MGRRGSHIVRKSKDKIALEHETIGYMPERFVAGYNELVRLGLKTDPSAQVFDNESGTPNKKYHTHAGGLKDEAALRFKAWVDRQLRAIGRDMQAYLNARDSKGPSPIGMSQEARREVARELERKTELKCSSSKCGKYISWQWNHCAWCGKEIHGKKVSDQGNGSDSVEGGSPRQQEAPADREQLASGGAGEDTPRKDGGEIGSDADRTSEPDAKL